MEIKINSENYNIYNVFEMPELVFGAYDFATNRQMSTIKISNKKVPETTKFSMDYSGGVRVRFQTQAKKILMQASVTNERKGNFPHVGICARKGISVLFQEKNNGWKIYNTFLCTSDVITLDLREYIHGDGPIEIMIECPILSILTNLIIGVEKRFNIIPTKFSEKFPIAFLGSMFTFGIGVTNSSMIFSNIISRKLNVDIYNFGIYDNNPQYDQIIDEIMVIPFSTLVIEADNIRQDNVSFYEKFPVLINKIRSYQPTTPIIYFNQPFISSYQNNYITRKEFVYNFYAKNQFSYFIDGENIFDEYQREYCSYSNIYYNDYAHVKYYQEIRKILEKL